jgi:hypothetical protein
MARKSLSDQVIEEIDRAAGLLRPVQEIVDPMTAHMVGAVLESLHRVETMCLAAKQRQANENFTDTPLGVAFGNDKLAQARHKSPTATKRPSRARKSAGGDV